MTPFERMTRRPHILFVVTEDWYFVSHRLALGRAAVSAGYRVTVATRVNQDAATIRAAGIDVVPFPIDRAALNPLRELVTIVRFARLYLTIRPDIVHHVAMKPVIYGSLAAWLTGPRRVVNALPGLGFLYTASGRRTRLIKSVVKRVLRVALRGRRRILILQNEDDRALFLRDGLIGAPAVRVIPGVGVDPDAFATGPKETEPCLVVLPARLLRDKGVTEFVEAARALKAAGVAARFALVGSPDPGNPNSIPQATVELWEREGAVECWGWRTDMARIFATADIVCLPSYREGMPKALLEAAAAGCAIVTTDTPGCRAVVTDGETGFLVPPRDATALAAALRRLIEDPPMRMRFGAASRRRAETEFHETRAIAATLEVYATLLDAP